MWHCQDRLSLKQPKLSSISMVEAVSRVYSQYMTFFISFGSTNNSEFFSRNRTLIYARTQSEISMNCEKNLQEFFLCEDLQIFDKELPQHKI